MWTNSSINRWDKRVPERTSSTLIKFRDHDPQGGVQPLVALVRGRKLHPHREHPQVWLALVSPAQPIASAVKPDLGPVGCFDDASRMNGAEVLPRWGLKPQYISLNDLLQEVQRREDQATRQNQETAPPDQKVQVEASDASWVCTCCRSA